MTAAVVDVATLFDLPHDSAAAVPALEETGVTKLMFPALRLRPSLQPGLDPLEEGGRHERGVAARVQFTPVAKQAAVERIGQDLVLEGAFGDRLAVQPADQSFVVELLGESGQRVLATVIVLEGALDQRRPPGVDLDPPIGVPIAQRGRARPLPPRELLLQPLLDLFGEVIDVIFGEEHVDPERHLPLGIAGIAPGDEFTLDAGIHQLIEPGPIGEVAQQAVRLVAQNADHGAAGPQRLGAGEHVGKEGAAGLAGRMGLAENFALLLEEIVEDTFADVASQYVRQFQATRDYGHYLALLGAAAAACEQYLRSDARVWRDFNLDEKLLQRVIRLLQFRWVSYLETHF